MVLIRHPLQPNRRPWQSRRVPTDDPPLTPEEFRARLARNFQRLVDRLDAIDREAAEKRTAAIADSGLPPEFVASALRPPPPGADPAPSDSGLTSREDYAQNEM